jgi:hypothetical protein
MKFRLSIFIYFLLAYIFNCTVNAQTVEGKLKIEWIGLINEYSNESQAKTYLSCVECSYLNLESGIPVKEINFGSSVVKRFVMADVVAVPLTYAELQSIDTNNLEKKFKYSSTQKYERRKHYTALDLQLIRKNIKTGQFEKLVSCTFLAEIAPAVQSRSNTSGARVATQFESVLAQGQWIKVGITKDGIYKITGNILRSSGISPAVINSANIQLYGAGGGMQPESIPSSVESTLQENAIQVFDGGDGRFDNNDYFVFYGKGQHVWNFNNVTRVFSHQVNIYADTTYYFITYDPTKVGKRVQTVTSLEPGNPILDFSHERAFVNDEHINFLRSGRTWYGDRFGFVGNRVYSFPVNDLISANYNITLRIQALHTSITNGNTFTAAINGQPMTGSLLLFNRFSGTYAPVGTANAATLSLDAANLNGAQALNVDLRFNRQNSTDEAFLDFIELFYRRKIRLTGNQIFFRNTNSLNAPTATYRVENISSNSLIWDVTNHGNARLISPIIQGSNAIFSDNSTQLKEYAAFNHTNLPEPSSISRIANQNITAFEVPDFFIITHKNFLSEAERLANFRRTYNKINTIVVTTDQIFNEFSSGAQDISAIRNFLAYYYNLGTDAVLQYALFMGAASYDYKNRLPNNKNFVPIFTGPESLHPVNGNYTSDDFYAILDYKSAGNWTNNNLDIGVGRLPVKSLSEATAVVNKLINYSSSLNTLGNWRNYITLVADDGDGCLHSSTGGADGLANIIENRNRNINVEKIYLATFPQAPNPGGASSPDCNAAILNRLSSGTLITNYTGHGSESQWADENIFNSDIAANLNNFDRLCFFITATCEFGRHEDPAKTSGAEILVLNPNGGAVGIMTTGRPVYSFSNQSINTAFYNAVFAKRDGRPIPLGEVFRRTKNGDVIARQNNRGFIMLGDPSCTLAFPEMNVVLTAFNSQRLDTLQNPLLGGLELVTFEGEVRDLDDNRISGFEGDLRTIIFDQKINLIANDDQLSSPCRNAVYTMWKNMIYNGTNRVADGKFEFSFVVPKDISYNLGFGKISLYARTDNTLMDATGSNLDFRIGGSPNEIEADDTPPVVRLFLNDTLFRNGGFTHNSPLFIAKLFDDNGLNTSTKGIGHEMLLTIDDDPKMSYVVNSFYTTAPNNFRAGEIRYPLRNLSVGKHFLTLKVWDTHNNSADARLDFVVTDGNVVVLGDIFSYPNPFSSKINIAFSHSEGGNDIEVKAVIYDIVGKKVRELNAEIQNAGTVIGRSDEIVWDGKNDDGTNVPEGHYICQLFVQSKGNTSSRAMKTQRLIKKL